MQPRCNPNLLSSVNACPGVGGSVARGELLLGLVLVLIISHA